MKEKPERSRRVDVRRSKPKWDSVGIGSNDIPGQEAVINLIKEVCPPVLVSYFAQGHTNAKMMFKSGTHKEMFKEHCRARVNHLPQSITERNQDPTNLIEFMYDLTRYLLYKKCNLLSSEQMLSAIDHPPAPFLQTGNETGVMQAETAPGMRKEMSPLSLYYSLTFTSPHRGSTEWNVESYHEKHQELLRMAGEDIAWMLEDYYLPLSPILANGPSPN